MNREDHLLFKVRDAAFRSGDWEAFRSGDWEAYSSARVNLRRGIFQAKHICKQRLEKHFNSSEPLHMWHGTDFKLPSPVPPSSSASFHDELNYFYAHFDFGNKEVTLKADLPPGELPLSLSTTDFCATLSRVNVWKAAGQDGIPGCVLRICAGQLARVFMDIFYLSLAQAVVSTSFKTATVVPVPMHPTAMALNDLRPVVLTPHHCKVL